MALAYLLSPTFEIVNTAGKPATGGYIEVYVSGTRDKYFCASDWNGTLHPFKIPLDSLGSNIVLAADGGAYDVFIYNRYGGLIMSRTNVKPGAGGGMGGGVITSSDGSITVTPTAEGVDLKVNGMEPSVLRAGAGSLTADGQYTFYELVRDGEEITVDSNGKIRLEDGWYHFDATVRVAWEGASLVNSTTPVQLYTTLSSDVLEFDLSYEHSETVQLSGETKITAGGTQFVLGITGLEQGMVAELVDFGIHTITGHGDAAGYEAGDGIVIEDHEISIDPNYVQETLSAGTGIVLEDNEISVDTDVIQEKLTAGSNIVIEGSTISATAEPQLQANWTEADSQSVQYIQNKPTIKPVVAGSNITITEGANSVTISSQSDPQVQADYAQSNSSAVDYIKNKPTIKPVVAGSNITITEGTNNVTIAATVPSVPVQDVEVNGTSVVNASGVAEVVVPAQQQADFAQSNSSAVDFIKNKPVEKSLVAGNNITITTSGNNVSIAATVPNVPVQGVEVDGTSVVNAQGIAEITMPTAPVQDVEVDGSSVVNASGVAEITMPTELVPAVGSVDNAKVLTAEYDSDTGTGSYSWEDPAGLFVAIYGTSTLAEVAAAVAANKNVYCKSGNRMAFLAYYGTGGSGGSYEFQYYRSNSNSSGTDSIFVYTLNWTGWSTTERQVKAGNISYPVTTVNVNGSSAMTGTVANVSVPVVGTITL